jgi:hypothetical protein
VNEVYQGEKSSVGEHYVLYISVKFICQVQIGLPVIKKY